MPPAQRLTSLRFILGSPGALPHSAPLYLSRMSRPSHLRLLKLLTLLGSFRVRSWLRCYLKPAQRQSALGAGVAHASSARRLGPWPGRSCGSRSCAADSEEVLGKKKGICRVCGKGSPSFHCLSRTGQRLPHLLSSETPRSRAERPALSATVDRAASSR